MIRYLVTSLRTQLTRGLSLTLLTLFGVALGVAAVLAIQIINRNALAAFRGTMEAVSGDAELSVVGRLPTFPESLYVRVLADPAVAAAWPVYRVDVAVAGGERFLEIVGTDLYQPIGVPMDSGIGDIGGALTTRGWVAVAPALAQEAGWRVGDTVRVTSGSATVPLVVGSLADFRRYTPLASSRLAVMDIAQAQALLGTPGEIGQIDIRLRPGAERAAARDRLAAALGGRVQVMTPERRTARAADLLGAFRLNLTALSLISLFVGLFLVYSSVEAALVRRRRELGLLRSLGATRGQVFAVILVQVGIVGAAGVAVGLPLGYWVARVNVDTVSATLSNLYLLYEIETLELAPSLYVTAGAIGIGGALVGALHPALDISRRDPVALLSPATLHEPLGLRAGRLAGAGGLLLTTAGVWYWWFGREWRPAGFALAVCLVVGLSLVTPLAVRLLAAPVRIRGFGLGYSLKSLAGALRSTSVAVAALAVAVTMLVGVTLMIGSFRRTVETWIDGTVGADVYVTTESWARAETRAPLDAALARQLATAPGVRAVDRLRGFTAVLGERRIYVGGIESSLPVPTDRFQLLAGDVERALTRLRRDGAVLISEPLARKADLGVGDTLRLLEGTGFPVAGVYYDYSNEAGAAVMDLRTMEAHFGPGPINNLALYLAAGADAEAMVDRLKARYRDTPLLIRSNRELRREVLRVFDQTFAVTRVLRLMGLVIAVGGLTLMLLVLARERIAELALYRALGAGRRQIFGVFVGKGVSMGLLALLLGGLGGAVLAGILIYVINRAYFGWTIQPHWPWGAMVAQTVIILAAAVAGSLYPAIRASRTPATELARE